MSRIDRMAQQDNQQAANIWTDQGPLEGLSSYICPGGKPKNFIISGVSSSCPFLPLGPLLQGLLGHVPIILLHNNDQDLARFAAACWENTVPPSAVPLWVVGRSSPLYEPFLGMSDDQLCRVLRDMARILGYTAAPSFDRVARSHLRVLRQLGIPNSLSGLHYLCRFQDLGELHDNVLALPCGTPEAQRIWAGMGADVESGESQFDLLRSVVNSFAGEIAGSGYDPDNQISSVNILSAMQTGAMLVLDVNEHGGELVLPYLAEELKLCSSCAFLLVIDGIDLDDSLSDFLCSQGNNCVFGILGGNVAGMAGSREQFLRLASQAELLISYKHGIAGTAQTISEALGRFDFVRVDRSSGRGRSAFSFLPRDVHQGESVVTENRYRVMPEEIQRLTGDQAIVLDVETDRIIYYN